MKDFNYEKAYFVQALPAFMAMNEDQKMAHRELLPLVKDSTQMGDLSIQLSEEMRGILSKLSCQEIAEMARASEFVGHWKPSHTPAIFENSSGESWKVSSVCDQVLRERLAPLPYNVLIHEGMFRVTFSNRNCWLWEEFGLATEKNLEIFKTCGLPFGETTIDASAEQLTRMCGDLWPDVEEAESNEAYEKFLILKREKALATIKEKHIKKLADLKRSIEEAKIELAGFQWLITQGVDDRHIDNCIYYNYTGYFCFGWRKLLTGQEREEVTAMMEGFPFPYEFKAGR